MSTRQENCTRGCRGESWDVAWMSSSYEELRFSNISLSRHVFCFSGWLVVKWLKSTRDVAFLCKWTSQIFDSKLFCGHIVNIDTLNFRWWTYGVCIYSLLTLLGSVSRNVSDYRMYVDCHSVTRVKGNFGVLIFISHSLPSLVHGEWRKGFDLWELSRLDESVGTGCLRSSKFRDGIPIVEVLQEKVESE